MIVMLMAPHLFLGVFDRHWYALGNAGSAAETPEARDDLAELGAADDVVPLRPNEEGIRVLLRQILLDQGPLRFVDLRERAAQRLRGKSPQSVGPILLTSGEFVRPLPGNRVLKRRLDAHVSPGLLALMVALGALQAPSQWQMFHKAGHRLTEIIRSLSRCLHERGIFDWGSSVAEELIQKLAAARHAAKSGWVDADVVKDLIAAAGYRAAASLPTAGEADESTSSFEDLLREVAESRGAEAAHQTMRAVLGGQK